MATVPQGYQLRLAKQGDIPALIAADRAASELFRPTGLVPNMGTVPESVPADTLSQSIDDGLVIVITDERGPVGFSLTQLRLPTLYLDQLSVDPAHGRKGLGRGLVIATFALAESRGAKDVTLSTFRDLPWNGPFYKKMGFREIPRAKLTDWMVEIEAIQAETLDVTKRCFMRRAVRRFSFQARPQLADLFKGDPQRP